MRKSVVWIVVIAAIGLATALASRAQAATQAGYRDGTFAPLANYPGSSNNQSPTADKAQSKVWWNAGSWWSLMVTPDSSPSVNIFRLLPDHTWTDTGVVVDTRRSSTGDALWTAGHLFVVSRSYATGQGTLYNRFEYNALGQTYVRSLGPLVIGKPGVESAAIARAADGSLWVTFTKSARVWVTHTTGTNDLSWVTPFNPSGDTSVSSDDISNIITFFGGIGVFWSDEPAGAFRFAVHRNGQADNLWQVETAALGPLLSDDHLSVRTLEADGSGRIYAAVKTSLDLASQPPAGDPQIILLTRSTLGRWSLSVVATIGDNVTRPNIVVDPPSNKLHVFFTTDPKGNSAIAEKTATLSDAPLFATGRGKTVIGWPGAAINNATTPKTAVTADSGIVVLASDAEAGRYYHAELT
jgi:hypothetical protein